MDEYDPACLRFGSHVVIRSALKQAGCVRLNRNSSLDVVSPAGGEAAQSFTADASLGGLGNATDGETFVLINPEHRSSDRVIMFSDAVRLSLANRCPPCLNFAHPVPVTLGFVWGFFRCV